MFSKWNAVRVLGIERFRRRRRPAARQPGLEPLESRRLMAATAPLRPATAAIIHNFPSQVVGDGSQPWGSLALVRTGKSAALYGTTVYGGTAGRGTIFVTNPSGTSYRVLHSFAGGAGDGSQPRYGSLQQVGSVLYGTTLYGGPAGDGVIFKININGTGFAVIHAFAGGARNGAYPYSPPTPTGSLLIGMTSRGGASRQGTLYAINDDGTGFHILYSFAQATGTQPRGAVTIQPGALYGMTRLGGTAGDGVIFRFDLGTARYTTLHQFQGGAGDGATPDHGAPTVKGGQLYGLTSKGGRANDGVLFRIDTSGTNFQIVHAFAPGRKNGIQPQGSLLLAGSTLYGTTSAGGRANQGVVFKIRTSGRRFQVLHTFAGAPNDGSAPIDNLVSYKGKLYGTTKFGGLIPTAKPRTGDPPFDNGVIFALTSG
jgi:uncharacterized repeat protein (TIGR03803 family)